MPQVNQAQREEAARQWRASQQANTMDPAVVEALENKILDGGADGYIHQLTTMNASSPRPPPPPGVPAPASSQPGQDFMIDLIRSSQLPLMPLVPGFAPIPPMPGYSAMPPMQPLVPTGFSPLPPMPMLPGMPPLPVMPFAAPFSPPVPPSSFTRDMASMPNMIGMPQVSAQTMNFPGGSAQNSNINFSGTMGGAQFSYSSSSTTGQWAGPDTMRALSPEFSPSTAPAQLQALPPVLNAAERPFIPPYGGAAAQSTTSARIGGPPPSTSFGQPIHRPRVIHSVYAQTLGPDNAPPTPFLYIPNEAAINAEPQNQRMHDAFAQQLEGEEETYFSEPPGLPDRPAQQSKSRKSRTT